MKRMCIVVHCINGKVELMIFFNKAEEWCCRAFENAISLRTIPGFGLVSTQDQDSGARQFYIAYTPYEVAILSGDEALVARSLEECPSCGFQFGVDDEREITYEAWREAWVEGGMKWWDDSMSHPEDWDPAKQLAALKATGAKEYGA